MAQQEEYLQDEDVFGTETSEIDELDELFAINKAEAIDISAATEDDRKVAKETGKAKPEAKKAEEKKAKEAPVEEEKILGSELEDDQIPGEAAEEKKDTSNLTEFEALSEGMFKAGIWTRDEDEDENFYPQTEEDFRERHQYEGQKLANTFIGQFATRHGEEAKENRGAHAGQYAAFQSPVCHPGLGSNKGGIMRQNERH